MDFRAVRYFEQVAEAGSLRAAAERLRVAASAISRTVAILESELGVELFNRSRTGMNLTPAGEIFLNYARGMTLELERVRAEIGELQGLRRGLIRLASVEGAVSGMVMKAIHEFRSGFPGVAFDLRVGGANVVTDALASRNVEIGISANGMYSSEIDVVFRADAPLLALISPTLDDPGRQEEQYLSDILDRYPIAIPDHSFGIRAQLEHCAVNSGRYILPVLVSNSVDAMRSFARLASGATFLPSIAVQDDLDNGRLVGIPLKDPLLNRSSIDLLTVSGRRLSPAGAKFIAYLIGMLESSVLSPRERKRVGHRSRA